MFAGNEDEDLFNPNAGSNLAALFGTSMTFKNEDANLSYTAPKQPKSETPEVISPKPTSSQSTVICSKFVNVFKQINGEYVSQGKCGIAIIGSQALNTYELIIYKSKQDIISRTKLRKSFIFKVQTDNFGSFIDDQQQQWSIHFDENELDNFVFELVSRNIEISHINENKVIIENKQENDADTSTTKAKILSRMAKMGQSILPASSKTIDSESDDTTNVSKRTKKKQKHVTTIGDQPTTLSAPQTEYLIVNSGSIPTVFNQPTIANFNPMSQLMQIPQTPDMFNIFLAESRTHNCEMRMNITNLSSKLDRVMEEVKNRPNQLGLSQNEGELHNKIEDYENLIKNSIEDLNKLQQENKNYKDVIANQESHIKELENIIKDQNNLHRKVEEQQQIINDLELKQAEQLSELKALSDFYNKHKDNVSVEGNNELKLKLEDYAQKHELFSKQLKKNMNLLYKSLVESFKDDVSFQAREIQQIIATNLRNATLYILQEFSNNFDLNGSNES